MTFKEFGELCCEAGIDGDTHIAVGPEGKDISKEIVGICKQVFFGVNNPEKIMSRLIIEYRNAGE
jgi:hypothetical protein